jgi:hypothetical protein
MKTTQYLDAVKKKLGIESDYALAKVLQLTRSGMSLMANGHIAMGTTTAAKVAEILELDPLKVIADAELERGSDDALWTRIAKKVAVVVLVALAGLAGEPSPAAAASAAVRSSPCVLCQIRRVLRRLTWCLGLLDLTAAEPLTA